jgi:polyphosphate kinase 2 PPK2
METEKIIKIVRDLSRPFRITKGKDFRLKDVDPNDTLEFTKEEDKPRAKDALAMDVMALSDLREKLYAQDRWAVLLIFHSFKSPNSEDLDHDYLWRCLKVLPNRGEIGIFNRSYYEEVLVVRVHPEFLEIRTNDPGDREQARAVVCRPCGQQMVYPRSVAAAVIETLADFDLQFPEIGESKRKELAAARERLM